MKRITSIIALLIVSLTSHAQQIGGKNSTVEVLGGMLVDSALCLPKETSFTGKGIPTTGKLFRSNVDSLPAYQKAGITKKVLTKWDSGTVYVDAGEVGNANGVASLNSFGVVPSAQLPAITISGQVYIDTSQAQMLGHSSAVAGALSVRTDSSSALYVLTQTPSSTRANWHITQGNGVSVFKNRTGAVIPMSGDYSTDSVAENPSHLYYTIPRTQSVIAADTAAGWLISQFAMNTAIAAAGSSQGLNAVLTNSPNSTRNINLGSKNCSNPYLQAQLIVSPTDSSGALVLHDTTLGTGFVALASNSGSALAMVAGGLAHANITVTSSTVLAEFLNGGRSSRINELGFSFSGSNNQLSATSGIYANQLHGVGNAPAITAGPGAGSAPTVTVTGTDAAGYITITTGTGPSLGAIADVVFSTAFASAPRCVLITPANSVSASTTSNRVPYVDQAGITTLKFTLTANVSALVASTGYKWYYTIIQ